MTDTNRIRTEILTGLTMLMHVCHENSVDHGFWPVYKKERNFGESIALIHSELSEALEADRKNLVSDKIPDYTGVEEELADAIIRIMDLAGGLAPNLPAALIAKMDYNRSRGFKHGKNY